MTLINVHRVPPFTRIFLFYRFQNFSEYPRSPLVKLGFSLNVHRSPVGFSLNVHRSPFVNFFVLFLRSPLFRVYKALGFIAFRVLQTLLANAIGFNFDIALTTRIGQLSFSSFKFWRILFWVVSWRDCLSRSYCVTSVSLKGLPSRPCYPVNCCASYLIILSCRDCLQDSECLMAMLSKGVPL